VSVRDFLHRGELILHPSSLDSCQRSSLPQSKLLRQRRRCSVVMNQSFNFSYVVYNKRCHYFNCGLFNDAVSQYLRTYSVACEVINEMNWEGRERKWS
jgi:hypothetical protein